MLRYAVALSALLLLTACDQKAETPSTIRPVVVVHPQPAQQIISSYPGEVRARVEHDLAFRVSGKVIARLVEVGTHVTRDQPLAELDPQDLQHQLAAARSQVTAAEANLRTVRAERERYLALQGRQLVSRSQFENAENLYRAGEARLHQAQADLRVASNQVSYTRLLAPQAGVIAKRMLEVGQVISAGQSVLILAADGEREVQFSIPEQTFRQFKLDQPVTVALWSHPGQRFAGKIRELSPLADSQSRTFTARVTFNTGEIPVELGQSAQVFTESPASAPLAVPLSALSADNGEPYVWVVNPHNSRLVRQSVRIGAYSEHQVPILEGLKADDWVVLAGVQLLQENQQVHPVDRNNRAVTLATREPQE